MRGMLLIMLHKKNWKFLSLGSSHLCADFSVFVIETIGNIQHLYYYHSMKHYKLLCSQTCLM